MLQFGKHRFALVRQGPGFPPFFPQPLDGDVQCMNEENDESVYEDIKDKRDDVVGFDVEGLELRQKEIPGRKH